MTDRKRENGDEENIARSVRELPPAAANPAFREALRSHFVRGRLAGAREAPKATPVGRVSPPQWWRMLVPVGAAIALLAVIFMINRGLELRVVASTGADEVRVDGQAVAVGDTDALDAAIRSASRIEVPPEATLDLAAGGVIMYELAGARMTLPPSPGRWFGRAAACSLFVGELRLKAGADFAGSELVVYTPDGVVQVTGTMLSIQCDSGGTCVCVLEGVAHVGVDKNDMEPVEPGYRKIMMRDGSVDIIPVLPAHRNGVLDFDRRVGREIDG